jgi:hypothetical protein
MRDQILHCKSGDTLRDASRDNRLNSVPRSTAKVTDAQLACFPSESGAAAIDTTGAAAALLSGRVLRDGEIVLLLLRPSRWFILLSSLRFLGVVLILVAMMMLFQDRLHGGLTRYLEAGAFLITGL